MVMGQSQNNFKMDELQGCALDHNLDIIGIVETWLIDSVLDGEIAIKDYIT